MNYFSDASTQSAYTLTVIVPALNEEENLSETMQAVEPLLEKWFNDYEILIFNDGSSDQTGSIADHLSSQNKKIRVIHNLQTMGLGYNYKRGVEMATKDYVVMIPGDNEISGESFEAMFKRLGAKEILIPYTINTETRPLVRRWLSKSYTTLINTLFGLKLRYFNGPVIHERSLIQSIVIHTDSFAYQSEALIKLIRLGHTYEEMGMFLKGRKGGKSKAFHLKNVFRVLKSIVQLFNEIHCRKKWQANHSKPSNG